MRPKFLDKNSRVKNRHGINWDAVAGVIVFLASSILLWYAVVHADITPDPYIMDHYRDNPISEAVQR